MKVQTVCFDDLHVGDRVKVRVATRNGLISGWRNVLAVFREYIEVRAQGQDDFMVKAHEILEKDENGTHTPTKMIRGKKSWYNGKSWNGVFDCPTCQKRVAANTNFMGGHDIYCNGKTTTKVKMGKKIMPLTKECEEQYIAGKSFCCPFCDSSDIEGGSFETDCTVSQEIHCLNCEARWWDVYRLESIEVIDEPTKEIKNDPCQTQS